MVFAHMSETEDTTENKAALHAAAATKVHPMLHRIPSSLSAAHTATDKVAAAHKRLSNLALSKLQDEGGEEGEADHAGEGLGHQQLGGLDCHWARFHDDGGDIHLLTPTAGIGGWPLSWCWLAWTC